MATSYVFLKSISTVHLPMIIPKYINTLFFLKENKRVPLENCSQKLLAVKAPFIKLNILNDFQSLCLEFFDRPLCVFSFLECHYVTLIFLKILLRIFFSLFESVPLHSKNNSCFGKSYTWFGYEGKLGQERIFFLNKMGRERRSVIFK